MAFIAFTRGDTKEEDLPIWFEAKSITAIRGDLVTDPKGLKIKVISIRCDGDWHMLKGEDPSSVIARISAANDGREVQVFGADGPKKFNKK